MEELSLDVIVDKDKQVGSKETNDKGQEAGTVSNKTSAADPAKSVVSAGANQTPIRQAFSNIMFTWELPAQVKVGEQFSAVLSINSPVAIQALPALIGFDPQVVQMVNVQEGEFFKQNNGRTTFTHRLDTQGKVLASVIRQSDSASDTGTNGIGKFLTITFKALKPSTQDGAKLQLLSANPEPSASGQIKVPVEKSLVIVP
jgi:general secretion pathway protein D